MSSSASTALLSLHNLTKRFPASGGAHRGEIHALENVSFELARGRVSALVGESGSGKSTTARLIARLVPPTSGQIVFDGHDVVQTEPRAASLAYRRRVQMIFQDPFASLNPVHTVRHHLARPLVIHGKATSERQADEQIQKLLASVGLDPPAEFAAKRPHQLSGGQRQRVAIARALAVEPDLILADEPVSMLDVSVRIGILNLMHKLKEERGISQLYITHDIASARYIADDTMVMYAGHMVEGAKSDDLVARPAHPYTQTLLAAVPNPSEPLRRRDDAPMRGDVPSLVDPPPGCPYAARCPKVMDVCRATMPAAATVAPRHWVRCHLYPG